jgi:CHAD domain-containing protein
LKNARANLRLLRDAVGRDVYARENAALRDAARPLSQVRDSKVMVDAVHALLERIGKAHPPVLVALRGRLQQSHADARHEFHTAQHAAASAGELESASQRIGRWRVSAPGASPLRDGVMRIYRKARNALKEAEAEPSAASFHELRKQLKYLRYAMAAIDTDGAASARLQKRAEALTDKLGEDHDLFVLQSHVLAHHPATENGSKKFFAAIEKRRAKLQSQALKRGRQVLSAKPKAFADRLVARPLV